MTNASLRSARSRASRKTPLRQRFVRAIYATHNDSPAVRDALARQLQRLDASAAILNVGCGTTRIHTAVVNLDIDSGTEVDCCGMAEALPFNDGSFALVVTQETLEHVRDPFAATREINRVLAPGGVLYCQLPFIIGYHPGPTDFWRFSVEGIQELIAQAGLVLEEVSRSVGPGTGFYRICVEFWAVAAATIHRSLYIPAKGVAAVALLPLKWLDPLLGRSPQADRIAGGYFIVARKPE